MPGLVPGIHVLLPDGKDVDGRVKPGHDDEITRDAEGIDRIAANVSRFSERSSARGETLTASLARMEREMSWNAAIF